MKFYLIAAVMLLCFFQTNAQTDEELLTKWTTEVCECLTAVDKITDEVGEACMIEMFTTNYAAITSFMDRKYPNRAWENEEEQGYEAGKLIGVKLMSICPEVMMDIIELSEDEEEQVATYLTTGNISKIVTEEFIRFVIVDNENFESEWIWLVDFNGSESFADSKSMKGKTASFEGREIFLYNHKKKDYRKAYVIERAELVD